MNLEQRLQQLRDNPDPNPLCSPIGSLPKVEKDHEYGFLYVTLTDRPIAHTVELDHGVHVDVDAEGRAVGVEM